MVETKDHVELMQALLSREVSMPSGLGPTRHAMTQKNRRDKVTAGKRQARSIWAFPEMGGTPGLMGSSLYLEISWENPWNIPSSVIKRC